ncbi:MAG TPA: PEP-utilizing enzyme [Solirubrobacteraceae bacterium]|jgi:pyruvate,water dikinase|nr:PEP-utilizing enzyme [Solirubrobacteraceae bacterium]
MSAVDKGAELKFEPSNPGPWDLDAVHFPRPATRYWSDMHPEALKRGFQDFTSYYGMLLDTLDYEYLHGFAYISPRPVAHEQAPERFQRAEEVWAKKLWRAQLRDWDEKFKPESIRKHRELQSVDPAALSDEELVAYLETCHEHHKEMIYQHMRHTGAAMVTIGDLLAHASEWTGVPHAELLSMMQGAAPVSAGASHELARMVAAIRTDPAAQQLLHGDQDPGETLEELRNLEGETGEAVNAYLQLTGYRLLDGFDISGRYALEMPDALLRAIRAQVDGADDSTTEAEVEAKVAEIREKVPEEHRSEFDSLVQEARLMYRIRDERGVYSDIWASGIMRRAALEGGRRVAARGRIDDPEHFIDASFEEMKALIRDVDGPPADELKAHYEWRTTHTAKDAPMHLGPPSPPPPDPSGLPPGEARMMRAAGITMDSMFAPSMEPHEEKVLHGLAASGGFYEGPARRVSGPEEFGRIVKGDVLITECTSEAFNILLPLLGALVTDSGGLLSHPAIVSREYGIPGVVGTRDATDRIADGVKVRVDGDKGEVTVVG